MRSANLLHHLIRPARGGAIGVVIVFAALLALGEKAGLVGIPAILISLSWYFKYGYILFDHVVRGLDEPPALDIAMLNPVDEQRPLWQLAILLMVVAGLRLVAETLPAAVWIILAVFAGLLFPASVAILGLEGNPFKAVYPVALVRMISGLGLSYVVILAVLAGVALLIGLVAKLHLWLVLELAITMFAILGIFSTLAGAVYERRHELGLDAWHSPERTEEKERQAERRRNEQALLDAYGQVRLGAHSKAWAMLQDWLTSRGHEAEDYRWLVERVAIWPDARYANRLAEQYVDRLLALKRNGEALDVVIQRLRVDAGFRPKSAATTLQIAQLAAQGGGASAVARMLLRDFGERFSGDSLVAAATALARHLGE